MIPSGTTAVAFVALLTACGVVLASANVAAQEMVFVVRHADPPPVLRIDEIKDDTPISQAGRQRAQALAEKLKDAGIDAIHTSLTRRAIETAEPLARALGLPLLKTPRKDPSALLKKLRENHAADRVLVVSHWRKLPKILKGLGHAETVKLGPSEYNSLFVVVPRPQGPPLVARLRY